jgi:hypothetical protein
MLAAAKMGSAYRQIGGRFPMTPATRSLTVE